MFIAVFVAVFCHLRFFVAVVAFLLSSMLLPLLSVLVMLVVLLLAIVAYYCFSQSLCCYCIHPHSLFNLYYSEVKQ